MICHLTFALAGSPFHWTQNLNRPKSHLHILMMRRTSWLPKKKHIPGTRSQMNMQWKIVGTMLYLLAAYSRRWSAQANAEHRRRSTSSSAMAMSDGGAASSSSSRPSGASGNNDFSFQNSEVLQDLQYERQLWTAAGHVRRISFLYRGIRSWYIFSCLPLTRRLFPCLMGNSECLFSWWIGRLERLKNNRLH